MTWALDSTRTKIEFTVKHMMVTTVRGRFTGLKAELSFDPDDLEASTVVATADASTVDTRDRLRDAYLRGEDGFNTQAHPLLSLKSTAVRRKGTRLILSALLDVGGHQAAIQLEGKYRTPTGAPGRRSAGMVLSGDVLREKLGLSFHSALEAGGLLVGKKVKLELDIYLQEV
jgi:polyisoprenoid-binding protein YceI